MKKILLLAISLIFGFNTLASSVNNVTQTMTNNVKKSCIYINNPDTLLERMLNKVKKENKSNDLFCDRDGMKMAYYLIEGEEYNLTLGIAISVDLNTTNDQFKGSFLKKLSDYKRFFETLDKKNLGKTPFPDKEVIRFYGQINGTDNFFIIGKYVNDLNTNEKKMIVNNHGKVFFEQINLFEGMRVEYSDEVVF